jgi:protein arginine kinase activator
MLCMLCQKKEARVHLTDLKEGKIKKVDLCEDCAKAKNIEDPAGFALADLLLGLGASEELAGPAAEGADLACPTCGFTQADFKKSGRLGCPACYETFKDGLMGILKSMHKGPRHTGKVPRALAVGREIQDRIKSLQHSLEEAVALEDYERAARLRDQIKALKEDPGAAIAH